MKFQDYKDFYEKVIKCDITIIENYAQQIDISPKSITLRKNSEKNIYKFYQEKRDYVRCNYMSKSIEVSLDRHKVAACMLYAILKAEPLKINRLVPGLPEKILMSNEYLAVHVAFNIIEMYKLDELGMNSNYQLFVPKTYNEQENKDNDYMCNMCRALYYLKIDNINKFDILAYANIFFLLEKYTDVFLKSQNSDETHEQMEL